LNQTKKHLRLFLQASTFRVSLEERMDGRHPPSLCVHPRLLVMASKGVVRPGHKVGAWLSHAMPCHAMPQHGFIFRLGDFACF